MIVQPYLDFDGRCDEAIAFYQKALGAEVGMLLRFKDCPDPAMCSHDHLDKVMHASLRIGESTIMASDGHCGGKPNFHGIALSLTVANNADAVRAFGALAEGGTIQMALTKTFFSSQFGMVQDRFGVGWMVIVGQ